MKYKWSYLKGELSLHSPLWAITNVLKTTHKLLVTSLVLRTTHKLLVTSFSELIVSKNLTHNIIKYNLFDK